MKRVYLTIFIILIFSLVGRQVLEFGNDILGRELFLALVIIVGLLCSYKTIGILGSITFGMMVLILSPFFVPEELVHVFLFGALGYFLVESSASYKFFWILALGVGDELLQWILPWRVCDMRDIVLNIISASVGILVYKLEHKKRSIKALLSPF